MRFILFFYKFIYFIYLFLAALGLHCCTQAFSGCCERGLLRCGAWASHCSGFSCCRARALAHGLQQLCRVGLVAQQHVGSSHTRDQTHVPCIGRRILFFNFFKIYLFIYFWLCWVFISVRGLSLVVASRGHSSLRCAGLSLSRPLLLQSTGFRRAGSVVVAHGPSCSAACGIFPDQGSNPCPLHQQADSQPLHHQGSPAGGFLTTEPPYIIRMSCCIIWIIALLGYNL